MVTDTPTEDSQESSIRMETTLEESNSNIKTITTGITETNLAPVTADMVDIAGKKQMMAGNGTSMAKVEMATNTTMAATTMVATLIITMATPLMIMTTSTHVNGGST